MHSFTVVALLLSNYVAESVWTASHLEIQIPQSLFKEGGYDHRSSLFGMPPYGGSIAQNVYYADSDLCDSNVDTHRGYPERERDENGVMAPWPAPYILMVDRGSCTFVRKVRNAQLSGAAAVIIADNTCLCSDQECVNANPSLTCETREPIMADDGSGSDITIPSFLMFKVDADLVKSVLQANYPVLIEMSWPLPNPDDRVEYDIWTVPNNAMSKDFFSGFKDFATALGDRAYFTPHMYMYDGIKAGCQGMDGENQCYNLCTNNGRYCATDPDNDLDHGISGADIVRESLRRICIWKEYGEVNGIGESWWDYVNDFLDRCSLPEYFDNIDCINNVYQHANVDNVTIDRCMMDSGGLEGDAPNSLLDMELAFQDQRGVVVIPTIFVNTVPLRTSLTVENVFQAICAAYATGYEPEVCHACSSANCQNARDCVQSGGNCSSIASTTTATTTTSTSATTPSTTSTSSSSRSYLMIHTPPNLVKEEGYDHRQSLFGMPPNAGSIAQNVYYADSNLCDPNVDTRKGHPERERDEYGVMAPWPAPYILMVDRGECTFVSKVRNAQRAGASAVVIADNTCLCSDQDCLNESDSLSSSCETTAPVMADDGSGADISIPSFLMFKRDADLVKAELRANHPVRMELAWSLPNPDERVEYDIWTVPTDIVSQDFLNTFKDVAIALGDRAYFTPYMYIYDGIRSGCQGTNGENLCYNLCTNNGRYCSTDPGDTDSSISGADVVRESLRRLCIWNEYGSSDGIGVVWWDYVREFTTRCSSTPGFFVNIDCIDDAYVHANVNRTTIENCMIESGGLEDDLPNSVLDGALRSQSHRGVVTVPSLFVNAAPVRGRLNAATVFQAICAGYATGSQPGICNACGGNCQDPGACARNGGNCSGTTSSTITTTTTTTTTTYEPPPPPLPPSPLSSPATSYLMIHIPHSLYKEGGYDHRQALFGMPPYGGSISQNVYYADSDLCDPNVDTRKGYPERQRDENGVMAPWPAPYILMVDRGACTFVRKVRNAQRSGAAAVIIADNTCLCSDQECVNANLAACETTEPIMADDGSGADISIPSFLMFKRDADLVKAELRANRQVQMELAWSLPTQDDRVEYDLWTVPTDVASQDFLITFKDFATALGNRAYFTPHMYVYDGIRSRCHGDDHEILCPNLCTNNGRYCAVNPDNDLDRGISGADIVQESLRRLCIWNHYGASDGIGEVWWDYIREFTNRCRSAPDYFMNADCINDAYRHANVDGPAIDLCMMDSGGLENDAPNAYLDIAITSQSQRGVVIIPTMFVNNAPIRGRLTAATVFQAICAAYAVGSEPEVCQVCGGSCQDPAGCVRNGGICPLTTTASLSSPSPGGDAVSRTQRSIYLGTLIMAEAQKRLLRAIRNIGADE